MSSGAYEIEAGVYARVVCSGERTADLELLLQIVVELLVDVVHHCRETVALVHLVAIPH